jgi:hypothetical protein
MLFVDGDNSGPQGRWLAGNLTRAGWKFNEGWLEILQPAHLKFFQPANLEDR